MPSEIETLYDSAIYTQTDAERYGGVDGHYTQVAHTDDLALDTGTISLSFNADRTTGEYALISKDSYGRADGGGFTLWLTDGMLQVSLETADGTEWLSIPNIEVTAGETHHVAVTFGDRGLELWYDGVLVAVESDFVTGIEANDDPLLIGASRAWYSDATANPHSQFQGEIGAVAVFDEQLDQDDMMLMLGGVNSDIAMSAAMQAAMADLLPVFGQMHHSSDTLKEIAEQFGVTHHGHLEEARMMKMAGPDGGNLNGTGDHDALLGSLADDTLNGKGGKDVLQGNYGNDTLTGKKGRDILDGGHGEDTLKGGEGNDLLISRADAREGAIAYDPDRDEKDPYMELTDGKLYPDQPIHGDDKLVGGKGADIFYFQTLINAKERFIQKHTNDDGTINWHGVAGENDNLHDHWVDTIGNDVIFDYYRSEGDRIVIEGHTTKIRHITYGDADGDGVIDNSVISIYSDQGSGGGAHNQDELGTITVYGDLITMADIETTAAPAYGIVASYNDIAEALAPITVSVDTGQIGAPGSMSGASPTYGAATAPVFAVTGTTTFDRDLKNAIIFDHQADLALTDATIAFNFSVSEFDGTMALFTKDASEQDKPGHLAAYIEGNGTLKVRFQDTEKSYYYTAKGAIDRDTDYDLAVSFGDDGVAVFLNGVRIAYNSDVDINWADNSEYLIFGAAGWSSTPGTTNNVNSHLNGTISDIAIFDSQLTPDDLYADAKWDDMFRVKENSKNVNLRYGDDGALEIMTPDEVLSIPSGAEFVKMNDATFRVRDFYVGTGRDDYFQGDDGSDFMEGKAGDDVFYGRENDDRLYGGSGNDVVYGEDGDDFLSTGDDNDRAYGGRGQDTVKGGDGNDTIGGDDARDKLYGGDGNDYVYGGNGNDLMFGGNGHDTLQADAGDDELAGGLGDDYLYGGSWGDADAGGTDSAVFDGNFNDYTFEIYTSFNSTRGADMDTLIVTDSADGGRDGYYEGADRLIDIDILVFADQTVLVDDLVF